LSSLQVTVVTAMTGVLELLLPLYPLTFSSFSFFKKEGVIAVIVVTSSSASQAFRHSPGDGLFPVAVMPVMAPAAKRAASFANVRRS
jgi:hypothetical protein